MKWKKDCSIALGMLVVAALFFSQTRWNESYLLPLLALGVMVASSVALLLRSAIQEGGQKKTERLRAVHFAFLCAMLLAVVLLRYLGFYTTLTLLAFSLSVYLEKTVAGKVNWLHAVIFTVVAMGVLFVLFNFFLDLRPPRGALLL